MKITYLNHSGFVVELDNIVLIFDYFRGKLPSFPGNSEIYVFASHVHPDHFQKKIFNWSKEYRNITYILSDDIHEVEQGSHIFYVGAREELQIDGLQVKTFRSTDEGVAFLVNIKGKSIYHAGDLNWWHWEEESPAYNEMMKRKYQHEIGKLKGRRIDVAFVPLDPRQEGQYYWGMDYFMRHTDTTIVFPMHMWNRYDVYEWLMENEEAADYKGRVMHIAEDGQIFER